MQYDILYLYLTTRTWLMMENDATVDGQTCCRILQKRWAGTCMYP